MTALNRMFWMITMLQCYWLSLIMERCFPKMSEINSAVPPFISLVCSSSIISIPSFYQDAEKDFFLVSFVVDWTREKYPHHIFQLTNCRQFSMFIWAIANPLRQAYFSIWRLPVERIYLKYTLFRMSIGWRQTFATVETRNNAKFSVLNNDLIRPRLFIPSIINNGTCVPNALFHLPAIVTFIQLHEDGYYSPIKARIESCY